MMRSLGKSMLRKSLRWRAGELLYRYVTKSWPASVAERIRTIRELAAQYHTSIFIETGTHLGDTTWGVRDSFDKLYTIEIEPNFAAHARCRFRNEPRITVLEGDSARVLQKLIPTIKDCCLIFLDAHFSGGISGKGEGNTPFRDEMMAIASSAIKNHIILIDDARDYTGENGYPTQEEVFRYLRAINAAYSIVIKGNFIIATA